MLVEIGKMEGGVGREGNSFIWMLVRFQGRPQPHNAAIKRIKQTTSGICCNLQRTVRSIGVETPKAWDTERERGGGMYVVGPPQQRQRRRPPIASLSTFTPSTRSTFESNLPALLVTDFFLTSALYQSVFEKLV